ncbi:MAG: hypothetical protein RL430_1228 [Actinomycetota bacterium]
MRNRPRPARMSSQLELIEGIAIFTEHLRDTIASSTGIEQAITATLETCPKVIEPELRRLVAEMQYGSLEEGLRHFADELAHPLSDFVVAALVSSIQNRSRDLSGLLTQLSASAREECRLHLRVWVSRSRTRSAVRIVGGSLVTFVVGLSLFDMAFLAPYASPSGLVVLTLVCSGFASGLWLLDRMSRFDSPVRLIGRRHT